MEKVDSRNRPDPSAKSQIWRRARAVVRHAFSLTRELEIHTLLVRTDSRRSMRLVARERGAERIVWVVTSADLAEPYATSADRLVVIPELGSNIADQIRAGLFSALIQGYLSAAESSLRLSGRAAIDSLSILYPKRDFPWLSALARHPIPSGVLDTVVRIALRLAVEGREGRAVGTTFVIGRMDELTPFLRQLILNPCRGHPRQKRSVRNPEFFETLRELTALDGALIINTRGVVESAGTYIDVPPSQRRLRLGLGARHRAAAGITAIAECVAVVLSESGVVRLFHHGQLIVEFESTRRL